MKKIKKKKTDQLIKCLQDTDFSRDRLEYHISKLFCEIENAKILSTFLGVWVCIMSTVAVLILIYKK